MCTYATDTCGTSIMPSSSIDTYANTYANIIFLLHCLFILFMLLIPFTNSPALLILHITACISLLIHWQTNSDMCCLTSLEAQLRGLDCQDTFIHRLVSPIYNININDKAIYGVTLLLMLISSYKLYLNWYKIPAFIDCIRNYEIDTNCLKLLF